MATAGNPSALEENPNVTTETTGTDSGSGPLTAIIIGGTGATGTSLVGLILNEKEKFNKIIVVGRRKMDSVPDRYSVNIQEEEASGRLVQVEQDMETDDNEALQRLCTGVDVLFCCLGTTRSAAGSAERFHQIDYGIPLRFAKAAKAAGVSHYSLVTSWGSNSRSMFLYLRTKGEIEDAIRELNFKYYTILRPGAINRGERSSTAQKIAGFFFKSIPTDVIAEAMIIDACNRRFVQGDPPPANLIMNNSMMYQAVQQKQSSSIGSSVDPPVTGDKNEEEVTEVTIEEAEGDGGKGGEEQGESKEQEQPEQDEPPTTGEQQQQPTENEQPKEEQSTEDEQTTEEKPTEEQPTEETEEKPTEEQPTEEQPTESDKPAEGDQPKDEQPKEEQPAENQ